MKFDVTITKTERGEPFMKSLGLTEQRTDEMQDFVMNLLTKGSLKQEAGIHVRMSDDLREIIEYAKDNNELVAIFWIYSLMEMSIDIEYGMMFLASSNRAIGKMIRDKQAAG